MKKNIGPRIEERTYRFYEQHFPSINFGATFAIEGFPLLYERALKEIKGVFTKNELSLILDVMRGLFMVQQLIGQHLIAEVHDGIHLNRLDQKWKVDSDEIVSKIRKLTSFQRTSLELWAVSFWQQDSHSDHAFMEKWIKDLL